jgi:hypothetical protein
VDVGEINGHPAIMGDNGILITVCANCGEMRTILFLSKDRWFCTKCRVEGATAPNLYPIS